MSETVLLQMKNIHKSFPGVKALQGVDLELRAGEVHALLGENGAGKSTLIKVLGGIYIAEEGEIFIDGQKVTIDGVNASHNNGISIIHQELVLVPHMTVAENIFLGREPSKGLWVSHETMEKEAQQLLDTYHMSIDAGQGPDHCPAADGGNRQGHFLSLQDSCDGRAHFIHIGQGSGIFVQHHERAHKEGRGNHIYIP